jgi:hydroxymethylpyrimidine pyrophosphatase-like HAD family hydrolase
MSQAPIRLIAIDVDGTLLDSSHRVQTAVAMSLAIFAERLGLDMSTVAAIGDGLNDIEMIEASAFGIAMGNAAAQVKSVADWVMLSQDETGVSEAVRELSRKGLI